MSLNRQKPFLIVISCHLIVAISAATVVAQAPKAKQPAAAPPLARPAVAPLRVENDPQLDEILKEWEKRSAGIQRLSGTHTRVELEYTFGVEKRAKGTFLYEAPDKGSFIVEGDPPKKDEVSIKKDAADRPFKIVAANPEKWVCNGKEVLRIDDAAKTFEKIAIPPQQQGQNIIDGPLPFLFGMKAQQAKLRYIMQLDKRTTADLVYLQVVPRRRDDAANYEEATVVLNRKTFLPEAVKLTHSANQVTYHYFKDVKANDKKPVLSLLGGDPLNPNLKGYQQIVHNAAATSPGNAPPGDNRPATGAAKAPPVAPGTRTATAPPMNGASLGKPATTGVKK